MRRYTLFASDERLAARVLSAVGEVRGTDAIRDRLSARYRVLGAGAWGDFQLDELRDDRIAPSAYVQVGIGSYRMWPIWYSVEGFVLLDEAGGDQQQRSSTLLFNRLESVI